MAVSHSYWHLVAKNRQFLNATDIYWSLEGQYHIAADISSGEKWQFHIAADI